VAAPAVVVRQSATKLRPGTVLGASFADVEAGGLTSAGCSRPTCNCVWKILGREIVEIVSRTLSSLGKRGLRTCSGGISKSATETALRT
jgi:hypothetical protein